MLALQMGGEGRGSSPALQGGKLMKGCYVAGDTVPPSLGLLRRHSA